MLGTFVCCKCVCWKLCEMATEVVEVEVEVEEDGMKEVEEEDEEG